MNIIPKDKSIFKKNWLIHNTLDKYIKDAIRGFAGGIMLDVGCGESPYKEFSKRYVKKYIGLEILYGLHQKSSINLFGCAKRLPIKTESCNTILCTELLEHVNEPDEVVSEMHRILKKGGYCILTTPFIWLAHEDPCDYYRFSKFGLEHLFEKNNFSIVYIKAVSGFWLTFGQLLVYYLWRFRSRFISMFIINLTGSIIQILSYYLDKKDRAEEFTSNYIILAKK